MFGAHSHSVHRGRGRLERELQPLLVLKHQAWSASMHEGADLLSAAGGRDLSEVQQQSLSTFACVSITSPSHTVRK